MSGVRKAHMIRPHSLKLQQGGGGDGREGAFGFAQLDEKCHSTLYFFLTSQGVTALLYSHIWT